MTHSSFDETVERITGLYVSETRSRRSNELPTQSGHGSLYNYLRQLTSGYVGAWTELKTFRTATVAGDQSRIVGSLDVIIEHIALIHVTEVGRSSIVDW